MPSPTATAIIGAIDCSQSPSKSLSLNWIRRSGFISSVGTSKRSRSTCCRFGRQSAAAGEHQLVDRPLRGGGREEVEGLADLATPSPPRPRRAPAGRRPASSGRPTRRCFSASACSNERLNSRCSASVNWLPPKEMSRQKTVRAAGQDVDVGHPGAHVDQRHDLARVEVVVHLVGVLHREGVDVDQRRGLARSG